MLWKPELWITAQAMVRAPLKIYVALPELWTDRCNEDWGYAYHLERWFHKFLLEYAASAITQAFQEADFVYIPHCAMNMYFSWKQARYAAMDETIVPNSGARPPEHGQGDVLHPSVLHDVDDKYLVREVHHLAQLDAAVSSCRSRLPKCRLLFVNMAFGRDDLPLFHAAVGLETVFVTTAGAKPRLDTDTRKSFKTRVGFTGCSCRHHCNLRQSLGPLDVVVPFAISHNSTSGLTHRGGKRDILAVFAGSNTSCSRRELFDRWANNATLTDHNMLISAKSFEERTFDRLARRSKFCIVIDGHWPATMRLPAVVAKGCIPVIISNRVELPFANFINWESASLQLNEGRIRELPEILNQVEAENVELMQNQLRVLAEALDYHHPRFHVLLLSSLAAQRTSQLRDDHVSSASDSTDDKGRTLLMDNIRFDKGSPDVVEMNAKSVKNELSRISEFNASLHCSSHAHSREGDRVVIVVMILSTPHDLHWRSIVRRYLPELTEVIEFLGRKVHIIIRFAVGKPPIDVPASEHAEIEEMLSEELRQHGDLARLNISDGWKARHSVGQHNGKIWHTFDWVLRNFPGADLIFKQDDDTIVNWAVALPRLLRHAADEQGIIHSFRRMYVGRLCPQITCCASQRCHLPSSMHCAAGHIYGLSSDIAKWIRDYMVPTTGLEDMLICAWVYKYSLEQRCGSLDPRGLLYAPQHENAWIHGVKSEALYMDCMNDRVEGCTLAESASILGEVQRFRVEEKSST